MESNSIDVDEVSKISIYDSKGEQVTFGSLFQAQKTIVVFIRHFFCGSCQAYVAQIASIPKNVLHEANVGVAIIGCGEWKAIECYSEMTGFDGPIFADPELNVYHALGMNIETMKRTPTGQQKRSYVTKGLLSNVISSIWNGPVKNPSLVGKQGNPSQLGGDFIFGPGNTCSFASLMQHTEDHVEVKELLRKAGISRT